MNFRRSKWSKPAQISDCGSLKHLTTQLIQIDFGDRYVNDHSKYKNFV